MRDGILAQVGTPQEVYRAPADLGVAEFVGAALVIDADVADGSALCDLGLLQVTADTGSGPSSGSARLMVRPEQILLTGSPRAGSSPAGASHTGLSEGGLSEGGLSEAGVEARVVDVSYFGHDAAVRLEVLGSGRLVTARVLGLAAPTPDSVVRLRVAGPVAAYSPGA
jgi:iron(III) transport system ATP-binding protein